MTLSPQQELMLQFLRNNNGSVVGSLQILEATGWKPGAWRSYVSNGFYDAYLTPLADDKFQVHLPVAVSPDQFAAEVSQSRSRRQRTAYRPFHADLVEELEALTRERMDAPPGEPVTMAEAREVRIREIANELHSLPAQKLGDVVVGVRLDDVLGKGLFGTAYAGTDLITGHKIAVKIFDADRLGIGTVMYHFRRGVRAMERLAEQRGLPRSVVRLKSVDEAKLAFSMEFISGGSIEGIHRLGWSDSKKLSFFVELCEAVQFAHDSGVTHRDIKPANVLVHGDGYPVLVDFDIADLLFQKTQSAGMSGTVCYSAPEELEGRSSREDVRGDVYSLGRLLHYFFLEKDPPLKMQDVPDLAWLRESMPESVALVVQRATMWNPDDRYQTVEELRKDASDDAVASLARGKAVADGQVLLEEAEKAAKRGHYEGAVDRADAAIARLPKAATGELSEWNQKRTVWLAATGDREAMWRSGMRWIFRGGIRIGFAAVLLLAAVGVFANWLGPAFAERWLTEAASGVVDSGILPPSPTLPIGLRDAAPSVAGGPATVTLDGAVSLAQDRPARRGELVLDSLGAGADPRAVSSGRARSCIDDANPAACLREAQASHRAGDNDAAIDFYERGCAARSGAACAELGHAFFRARLGVRMDHVRARHFYQLGCTHHSAVACNALGTMWENGFGGERSLERAQELYRRSCDGGHASGCESLAVLYRWGRGVERDALAEGRYLNRAQMLREEAARRTGGGREAGTPE